MSVTLDDTLNILAYTYCFTKPQNNNVLFKSRAVDNAIKLKIHFLEVRQFDRSTYHFNFGSFWFEMRHPIQSLSDSSCFYRVSKTHFDFFFSATRQRNKFGVVRSIFTRNLFLSRSKEKHLINVDNVNQSKRVYYITTSVINISCLTLRNLPSYKVRDIKSLPFGFVMFQSRSATATPNLNLKLVQETILQWNLNLSSQIFVTH